MQKIRKSVMDDKSLSTYAHNVKIIAGWQSDAERAGAHGRGKTHDRAKGQ